MVDAQALETAVDDDPDAPEGNEMDVSPEREYRPDYAQALEEHTVVMNPLIRQTEWVKTERPITGDVDALLDVFSSIHLVLDRPYSTDRDSFQKLMQVY